MLRALTLGLLLVLGAAEEAVVQTQQGLARGTVSDGVGTWRGLPYAAPPVGSLRWQDPAKAVPWSGVRIAEEDGAACPQVCVLPKVACPPRQNEDCLFLNVFAPHENGGDDAKKKKGGGGKAVLFFIHGGNFYQGYGGGVLYDGTSFVRNHDVVLVSTNYRLGALGFLYSGAASEQAGHFTGNYALSLSLPLCLPCTDEQAGHFTGNYALSLSPSLFALY